MSPARRTFARSGSVVLATAVLVGCGTTVGPSGQTSTSPSNSAAGGQSLTVFAAASLKNSFDRLGSRFESATGTKITFNFAGSADLVAQLQQGAPADVFASADTKNMDKASADDLVEGSPIDFATNTLEIAVPPDNPAKITSFADLADPGVKVVVCAPQVPCGSATQQVEAATKIELSPVSEENAVTDVLNKVISGEADAGVVYRTDVQGAAGKVTGVAIPEARTAVNVYPIAVLADSSNTALARRFVELVTGPDGQQVLTDAGFGRP